MTYDFFLQYYDVSEYELKKLYIRNHHLYMDVIMPIRLELIANGYRPEMNMDQEKTFIFEVDGDDCTFSGEPFPEFMKDEIRIGNVRYLVSSNTVTVTPE